MKPITLVILFLFLFYQSAISQRQKNGRAIILSDVEATDDTQSFIRPLCVIVHGCS